MMWSRLSVILTMINGVLLVFAVTQIRGASAEAKAQDAAGGVAPVLRGRALELVDDHGRVRAEIKMFPAQPNVKMPDGTIGFPEAVQLRLVSSKGAPNVKLVATEDGAGVSLDGEAGYVQILSRKEGPLVKLLTKDGRQQVITAQGSQPSK
jgi:hypothetical protein